MAEPQPIYIGGVQHRAYLSAYLGLGALSLIVIGIPFFVWRWLSTRAERWAIDDQRVEHTVGVLTRRTDSLELWRIHDLAHIQTFADRLCGDGRIVIHSGDVSDPVLTIRGVPDHRVVYERLRAAVEASRRAHRVMAIQP